MSTWYIKDGSAPYLNEFPVLHKAEPVLESMWYQSTGAPSRLSFPQMPNGFDDYPLSVWISVQDNPPVKKSFANLVNFACCKGCINLSKVTLPSTLQSIGKLSFANTALTEVTLPPNCTYYKTSFPEGCKIKGGKLING